MVKTIGSLSDLAVKATYPEFTPLDLGAQDKLHPIHLQKHKLYGMRHPKSIKRTGTVSRFPINDLKNFATFSDPANKELLAYEAIMNYRQELGSHNIPSGNLEISYRNSVSGNNIVIPPTRIANEKAGVQPPASLTLGKLQEEGDAVKEKEEEVLAKLNKEFRDDPDKLSLIEAQYHQTGANELLNIPM